MWRKKMRFFKTYTNAWKRKNKKLIKIHMSDIEVVEEIHKNLDKSILDSLDKQIKDIGDDKDREMKFMNYHRNTIVVRPLGYGKYAVVSGIAKPDQDRIREKIAYLVKNKDFDEPVVIDKKTLDDEKVSIYSGEYNVLAAIALGIKSIRVMVRAD